MHHLRAELTPEQMHRVCIVYLQHFHNPYLTNNLHMMAAKVLYSMLDCIAAKDTQQNAGKLLTLMLESSVQKLEAMALVHKEVLARVERIKQKASKDDPDPPDYFLIEKARPVAGAVYAVEKPEELISGVCLTPSIPSTSGLDTDYRL